MGTVGLSWTLVSFGVGDFKHTKKNPEEEEPAPLIRGE
jgi:hypothetical protein